MSKLDTLKSTALHMGAWVFLCYDVLEYFGYKLSCGIAGPHAGSILSFWEASSFFHSGCTRFHSHQQWVGSTLSQYASTSCYLLYFMLAILTDIRKNLQAVLICISLITENFEQYSSTDWTYRFLLLWLSVCSQAHLLTG